MSLRTSPKKIRSPSVKTTTVGIHMAGQVKAIAIEEAKAKELPRIAKKTQPLIEGNGKKDAKHWPRKTIGSGTGKRQRPDVSLRSSVLVIR